MEIIKATRVIRAPAADFQGDLGTVSLRSQPVLVDERE